MVKFKYNRQKQRNLERNISRLQNEWENIIEISMEKLAEEVVETEKKNVPVVTGNGRDSITKEKRKKFTWRIGHDKEKTMTKDGKHSYMDIVFYGIKKGYTIKPKKAKALRFVIDGEVIFAKSVYIPPRKGNDFIGKTVKKLRSDRRINENIFKDNISKSRLFKKR